MTIGIDKNGNDNSCNNIDLAKLAVIAAFLTLSGDFLAFILALLDLQKQNMEDQNKNKNRAIRQKIAGLEDELYKLKKELDD